MHSRNRFEAFRRAAVFRRLARRFYRPALLALGTSEHAERERASSVLFIKLSHHGESPGHKPVKNGLSDSGTSWTRT